MWGQGVRRSFRFIVYRIIPTRVGTRLDMTALVEAIVDHPHACGDKFNNGMLRKPGQGSSPRVWGQGALRLSLLLPPRIIPTRVGTSK